MHSWAFNRMYTIELDVFQQILVKIAKLYSKFTNNLEDSNPEYFEPIWEYNSYS